MTYTLSFVFVHLTIPSLFPIFAVEVCPNYDSWFTLVVFAHLTLFADCPAPACCVTLILPNVLDLLICSSLKPNYLQLHPTQPLYTTHSTWEQQRGSRDSSRKLYTTGVKGKYILSNLSHSALLRQVINDVTFIRAISSKVYWLTWRTASKNIWAAS